MPFNSIPFKSSDSDSITVSTTLQAESLPYFDSSNQTIAYGIYVGEDGLLYKTQALFITK